MSPKKFGPKEGGSYLDRAKKAWGADIPDWVEALAIAADKAPSQAELNKQLKFKSASVISGVLGRTYPGKTDKIEQTVRGALMNETVRCPMLGVLAKDVCVQNQKKKFTSANPRAAQLWTACRSRCPNALPEALKEGAR